MQNRTYESQQIEISEIKTDPETMIYNQYRRNLK